MTPRTYPVPARDFSLEEISEYFGGSKIECLLCGKLYKSLGYHLSVTHGVTLDGYRERYGLPYTRGLDSASTLESRGDAMAVRLSDPGALEALVSAVSAGRAKQAQMRKSGGYRQRESSAKTQQTMINHAGPVGRKMSKKDLLELLGVMADREMTLFEATKHVDTFSYPTVTRFIRRNNMQHTVRQAVENLPFHVQAKGEQLGHRFKSAVAELRSCGLSDVEIAKKLGVTRMTVTNHGRTEARPPAAPEPPREPPSRR